MLHGSPGSQHSRTASSCTQVDEEDDDISLVEEEQEHERRLKWGPSFTESEIEEWSSDQPENSPKSVIQQLAQDLNSRQFNEDAHVLFLTMENSLDDLRRRHNGSSDLIEEVKWRLANIRRELCRQSAIAD